MATLDFASNAGGALVEYFVTLGTVSYSAGNLRVNPATTGTGSARLRGYAATWLSANYNAATLYYSFYFRYETKPASASEEICAWINTSDIRKASIRIDSAGNLSLFGTDGTTQIGSTGSTVLAVSTQYRISGSIATGASAACVVKIDGVSEISASGNTSTTNHGYCGFGKEVNRNGNSVDFYYNRIVLSDSAEPPAGVAVTLDVDSDGNDTTWTIGAGSGSDFQQVDDWNSNGTTDGNTTYLLSTLTIGNKSGVGFQTGAAAGLLATDVVNIVKGCNSIIRNAANATASDFLRSATTYSNGSNFVPTNSYLFHAKSFDTDPATGAAWATAAIDSVEVGVTEQDSGQATRWSAGMITVYYSPAPAVLGTELMGRPYGLRGQNHMHQLLSM